VTEPVRARVDRFPTSAGTRLVAHVEVDGSPVDTLAASWAVVDTTGHVVTRVSSALAPSACAPDQRRAAEFAAVVGPGVYRIDLAVQRARRSRGVAHLWTDVASSGSALGLSDLVLFCGAAGGMAADGSIRLEPRYDSNLGTERALTTYFEIHGLTVGRDDVSRVRTRWRLFALPSGSESRVTHPPAREFVREDSPVGPLRRQSVTVPLEDLPKGRYRLEIEVTDVTNGAIATAATVFSIG